MRRYFFVVAGCAAATVLAAVWACSSSSSGGNSFAEAGPEAGPMLTLGIPCTDMQSDIYAAPGSLSKYPDGAIVKCYDAGAVTLDQLNKIVNQGSPGYQGTPLTSGAHVYDILYVTQRGDLPATLGWATAAVLVPDTPRTVPLPVVAALHAMSGIAANCAPSKTPLTKLQNAFWGLDYAHMVLPLVGSGYIVVAPDFPGYAGYGQIGNSIQGYGSAQDMARSTLDSMRALVTMFGSGVMTPGVDGGAPTSKLVLVGDGIGANGALVAASIVHDARNPYAPDLGKVAGIALYDPLWISPRIHGSLFMGADGGSIIGNGEGTLAVWYHYTNGELMDGIGHGGDVFQDGAAPNVKAFVDKECTAFTYPELVDAGMTVDDIFDPNYAADILAAVPEGGTCDMAMDPVTCSKWLQRFDNDRPHIAGVTAPVFVAYGGHDQILTPDWAKCAFDRFRADLLRFEVCYDSAQGSAGIVSTQSSFVNDWIAHQTLGGDNPSPCAAQDESAIKETCNQSVPNN
jgi:pimeloyl-ACP methyl ester carboxylesterase